MNKNNEYLNRVEKTKKSLEKVFSCPISYHEEGGWNGKNGHFIIKLNTEIMGNKKWLSCHEEKEKFVLTPIEKSADGLEKVLDNTKFIADDKNFVQTPRVPKETLIFDGSEVDADKKKTKTNTYRAGRKQKRRRKISKGNF